MQKKTATIRGKPFEKRRAIKRGTAAVKSGSLDVRLSCLRESSTTKAGELGRGLWEKTAENTNLSQRFLFFLGFFGG